ncbi:leucyl aminopeptidase family protein [Roseicitreum antarcticum]|uniref:Leucyl aminopeptidase n=1 Tax=Roseicitreum antarcticum TaxID=564137 RepID=A0A1H2VN52_9RHOB|nr:leucyl aminopeptidase family protein [Roseicitreum antarcticum]SDW69782.1 leucyl aminopeptidase [Roseicitreum antarcticum]
MMSQNAPAIGIHEMMRFAPPSDAAVPLHAVFAEDLAAWRATLPDTAQHWLTATGFAAQAGQVALVPGADGALAMAVVGMGGPQDRARLRFVLGGAVARLPALTFSLATDLPPDLREAEVLGWLLAAYRFTRFRPVTPQEIARLVAPEGIDAPRLEVMARAEALIRDLINTPASHLGPEELEGAALAVAEPFGAQLRVIRGEDLLTQNFPLIHAVGRAATRAPRLLDMTWGATGPQITLVGKGVCFDTGGLNLKPGASMGLMKKDMGGAAHVLGLAQMIMALNWPVRLRVLIPAVENAVAGNAMRPGDILIARNGLSVEVNNTDAEGRLVLADALSLADEAAPDLLVCMATLTGAARVALGGDLAPFFTDDVGLAAALMQAGGQMHDPVWQMPFHAPYEALIEPGIADLDNAPAGGMGGAITAALFLRRFVAQTPRFVHFDVYGWQASAAAARPKGGLGQGVRALLAAIPDVLDADKQG